MEAIGTEVMVVLSFPVIAVTFLVVYYWDNIKRLQNKPAKVTTTTTTNVVTRPGQITSLGERKEIRRSNVREERGQERDIDNRRTENIVSRHTRRPGETTNGQVTYTGNQSIREHSANVRENLVAKNYEIVIEKPVFVEKIVNVPIWLRLSIKSNLTIHVKPRSS